MRLYPVFQPAISWQMSFRAAFPRRKSRTTIQFLETSGRKMGYRRKHFFCMALPILFALAIGCGVSRPPTDSAENGGAQLPFSNEGELSIPKDTPIYVHLLRPLSSSSAKTGQTFEAVMDEPLEMDGRMVAPQGAKVSGRVVAARESGHVHDGGYLRLTLSSLTLKGKEIPIQTSSIFVEGGSFKNRSLAYSGGGTGGNALLGALMGDAKGGLASSTVGAVGGATAAYSNGKKEVGFNAERKLSFRFTQPLTVDPSSPVSTSETK
ncbi:MAG TPA: hypothetical protein VKZ53_20540 [Candidatus Angelobacter sp.]|nr:hypothetical protein [Candidatus Angelobacter sp.]